MPKLKDGSVQKSILRGPEIDTEIADRAEAYLAEMESAFASALHQFGVTGDIDVWGQRVSEHRQNVRTARYILTGSSDEKGD